MCDDIQSQSSPALFLTSDCPQNIRTIWYSCRDLQIHDGSFLLLPPAYSLFPRKVFQASTPAHIPRHDFPYRYVCLISVQSHRLLLDFPFRRSHSTLCRLVHSGSHPGFPLLTGAAAILQSDQPPGLLHIQINCPRLPLSTFSIAAVPFLTYRIPFHSLPRKPARFPNRNGSTPRTVLLLRHRVLTFPA